MSLDEYIEKRNFDKTTEPAGKKAENDGALRFSVQRHDASRLHYDLRLEMEGVLKSWAIPKGPSLNPDDKRLAIRTEDHPYDYLTFEGTIEEGNYGAGTVELWDLGIYHSTKKEGEDEEKTLLDELENGNLKIKFEGQKLKGKFALVKMKNRGENNWLFIKKEDEHSVDNSYDSEDYLEEVKKK